MLRPELKRRLLPVHKDVTDGGRRRQGRSMEISGRKEPVPRHGRHQKSGKRAIARQSESPGMPRAGKRPAATLARP